jgi:hypothetical protein
MFKARVVAQSPPSRTLAMAQEQHAIARNLSFADRLLGPVSRLELLQLL